MGCIARFQLRPAGRAGRSCDSRGAAENAEDSFRPVTIFAASPRLRVKVFLCVLCALCGSSLSAHPLDMELVARSCRPPGRASRGPPAGGNLQNHLAGFTHHLRKRFQSVRRNDRKTHRVECRVDLRAGWGETHHRLPSRHVTAYILSLPASRRVGPPSCPFS